MTNANLIPLRIYVSLGLSELKYHINVQDPFLLCSTQHRVLLHRVITDSIVFRGDFMYGDLDFPFDT